MTTLKKLNIGPYEALMLLLIIAALLLRYILLYLHWPVTDSDESIIDLMAVHIAYRGEHPIFFYGQAYMGALEAYIGALCLHLFGPSIFSVRLGLLPFFALFLFCMYLLTSLLYTKRFALINVALLSLGASSVVMRQLRAIGGYPEIMALTALIFLLVSQIVLSSPNDHTKIVPSEKHRRIALYTGLGFTTGLALWTDQLIIPCLISAALLLISFCWRELRTSQGLYLILALLSGALPLILYNLTCAPGQDSLHALLKLHSNSAQEMAAQQLSLLRQPVGAALISLPTITNFTPLCPIEAFPFFGPPGTWSRRCVIVQGSWSFAYLALWSSAVCYAVYTIWRNRRQTASPTVIKQAARLMLLSSAALTFAQFVLSPSAALYPISSARYLLPILLALPALLWPLWRGMRKPVFSAKTRVLFLSKAGTIILIFAMFMSATVGVIKDVPVAQRAYQQQDILVQDLLHTGVTRFYSEYWTCNRLIFHSNERIICASLDSNLQPDPQQNRYPPYLRTIAAIKYPTYIFSDGSDQARKIEHKLHEKHLHYQHRILHNYAIYAINNAIRKPLKGGVGKLLDRNLDAVTSSE